MSQALSDPVISEISAGAFRNSTGSSVEGSAFVDGTTWLPKNPAEWPLEPLLWDSFGYFGGPGRNQAPHHKKSRSPSLKPCSHHRPRPRRVMAGSPILALDPPKELFKKEPPKPRRKKKQRLEPQKQLQKTWPPCARCKDPKRHCQEVLGGPRHGRGAPASPAPRLMSRI